MIKTFEHEEANPMAMYVVDPYLERRLKAERISSRSDRFDEVWDGVYFMPPVPNHEHQFFQTQLAVVLPLALGSVDRELLLTDRQPWSFELFRLQGQELISRGRSTIGRPTALISSILPVSFRLIPPGTRTSSNGRRRSRTNGKKQRPGLEILHQDG